MLEYMHVKNLALIKECEIQFTEGLNILTGETGAGKSILLGSINLALGAKADKDIIRTGEEEGYVELVFTANDYSRKLLAELELPCEDDIIAISRKITSTKNIFKINGEIVPARQVRELAGGLLDMHGQHEHQSLLNNAKQRDMLDAFGSAGIAAARDNVRLASKAYLALKSEYDETLEKSSGREREISLLRYQCEEIENAKLIPGEDEALEEEYKKMQSSEKLLSLLNEAMSVVSAGAEEDAGSLVSRALSAMRKASSYDEGAEALCDILSNIESLIGDFAFESSRYADTLEFSEEDFAKTEERINIINSLKLKFGNTIEKITEYYDGIKDELEKLENLDAYLNELQEKTQKALSFYKDCARKLSKLRREASREFETQLTEELKALSFLDVMFEVSIESDEEAVSENGFDKIDFRISTNPGEPIKPIKNVASGGELSRIMLAIKTLLARKDEVDALIFDEIDAGISGRTAWEVASKLSRLSREHQVIAITHLAQIAAFSDNHFEIRKSALDNTTTTRIEKLSSEGHINELARLLGSDSFDEATISNAKELVKKAEDRKKEER